MHTVPHLCAKTNTSWVWICTSQRIPGGYYIKTCCLKKCAYLGKKYSPSCQTFVIFFSSACFFAPQYGEGCLNSDFLYRYLLCDVSCLWHIALPFVWRKNLTAYQNFHVRQLDKGNNYTGSTNPKLVRERSYLGAGYQGAPLQRKRQVNGDQEGCRLDLKPSPDDKWS
jgi:hypothetical protein